jgi:phosphatidylserine/phosphatidylglycerophosphate/cardiolipin synthase-like enzyme
MDWIDSAHCLKNLALEMRRLKMFSILKRQNGQTDLIGSKLFSDSDFYPAFQKDLQKCQHEVIIESPFMTRRRLDSLLPILQKLKARRVRVIINTRDPLSCDDNYMREDASRAISTLQHMGVQVLFTGKHHRKLAILDRNILWEGSLNILSQNDSCEIMRRTESTPLAWQMIQFIVIDKLTN